MGKMQTWSANMVHVLSIDGVCTSAGLHFINGLSETRYNAGMTVAPRHGH